MTREDLIRRLSALEPPTPASALVLLWTYYQPRIGAVENGLRRAGIQPLRVRMEPEPDRGKLSSGALGRRIAALGGLVGDGVRFDHEALRLAAALDRALHDQSAARFEDALLEGMDGRLYRLRRRNNFLADHYESRWGARAWAATQGRTMLAYVRHVVLVPFDPAGEIRIQPRSQRMWGSPHLHGRLALERQRLKVMLWPFQAFIDYPALDGLAAAAAPPPFLSLRDPRNEEALKDEVHRAVDEAASLRTTVLVFPELSFTPGMEEVLRVKLGQHGAGGHPLLTIYGLCHARNPGSDADLNEAVLLGPDGSLLHRHRKLVPFTAGGEYPCGERLHRGNEIVVLESALGNLCPLICLDLLNDAVGEAVARSHANVLVVPSLSAKTTAHLERAKLFAASQLAGSFVCNRPLRRQEEPGNTEANSLYFIPRKKAPREAFPGSGHDPQSSNLPYLLYSL